MSRIDAQRNMPIPYRKALDTPQTRLFVPINTSKATSRGIEADATVIERTKLPRMLIFCIVRIIPDIAPNEPAGAFAITALLLEGKNIAEPIPETQDAGRTTVTGVSIRSVR